MELCVRYCSFFEKHSQYINPVLQNFLQLVHHPSIKVKTRSWYLFQRYVRHLRSHIGNVAESVIENLSDLLPIKAEVPEEEEADEASSEDHDSTADAVFNSQLYLFEAIGCICGSSSVSTERQVLYVQTVMSPIFADMEQNLQAAKGGDDRAVLQVHHDLMALGTLARGFSDWTPGSGSATPGSAPSPAVQAAFARVSEASLVALKSLNTWFNIRTAARFAFSRLIGVLGARILPQLPDWIEGLLTQPSTKDEMALFLRLLEQVIYGFKNEISSILDSLFTHLVQRVFRGLAEPCTGTDDEIQLAELKREYLNFLIIILNNDLGRVIVSAANQPIFESVIGTIEHFARDAEDAHTARMAFQLLTKMCSIWGGPDLVGSGSNSSSNSTAAAAPPPPASLLAPLPGSAGGRPSSTSSSSLPSSSSPPPSSSSSSSSPLPGFERFMMARLSPLCWAVPMHRAFNAKDAQARQVLAEAALLQKTIYAKTGPAYLAWLRDEGELRGTGMTAEMIDEYLRNLVGLESRAFKVFFQNLVTKGGVV
jgi:exportin-T